MKNPFVRSLPFVGLVCLFLLGAPASLAAAQGSGGESVLRTYDLGPLVPRTDGDAFEESLLVSAGSRYLHTQRTRLECLYQRRGDDALLDILGRLLGDELEQDGRALGMDQQSRLLVEAPESVQEKIGRVLAGMEQALGATAVIQVDLLELGEDAALTLPGPRVLEEAEVDRLLAASLEGSSARRSATLRLSPGRTSALELRRSIPLVADYDVEIAQGSMVHDPVVTEAEAGLRMLVRGAPAQGGLNLAIFLMDSRAGEVRTFEVAARGMVGREEGKPSFLSMPTTMQSVELAFRSAAFNTFLPEGKAIVGLSGLDLGGVRSRMAFVIRRLSGGLPMAHTVSLGDSQRQVILINGEAFRPPRVTFTGHLRDPRFEPDVPSIVAKLVDESPVYLFDWLKARFSVWRKLGPWAVVVTDPAWDGDAAARLQAMLAGWEGESGTVDVALVLGSPEGSAQPAYWGLPIRPGTTCALLCGVAGTSLRDYDVEVAQFASAIDPVVPPSFAGLGACLRPGLGASGSLGLDVRALANVRVGQAHSLDLGSDTIGHVEQATFDRLFLDDRVGVAEGEALPARFVLGNASSGGGTSGLSLEISLRP